ncbi:MAG: polyphosphate kinase 1 [Rhodothermaceae bacterium]|nr:polyphosphate kinase 1 [Rhodothermaceae bacterium]
MRYEQVKTPVDVTNEHLPDNIEKISVPSTPILRPEASELSQFHDAAEKLPKATDPAEITKVLETDHPDLYFNRELSWLDFNWRVLFLSMDKRVPLLERVRFLSIASSNLDEFFRKRVGGLKRQIAAGVRRLSPDGRTPEDQILLIARAVPSMYKAMGAVWNNDLKPALKNDADVWIKKFSELEPSERHRVNKYFHEQLFPILTPLAVDPGHPFPFISNLSLSLAVNLRHPVKGSEHFARIKVPTGRGRWIRVNEHHHYVPVEQVIAHNVQELFRGMDVLGVYPFRITRNADLSRNEEVAEDLLEMISEELRARRYATIVRLEVQNDMPAHIRLLLRKELGLQSEDVYETMNGMVDHSDCADLANLNLPEHQYISWEPVIPDEFKPEVDAENPHDIFATIKHKDILVHHPYESFHASTLQFIKAAAEDPQVLSIKQTIYRTSDESPIIKALVRAAERGKSVAVLVEVKARFDEENNIEWAKMLEKSEVHVTYGVVGLKTHSKVTLVIREEDGRLQTYCHIGTGNYNPSTARLYTDLGLFTADLDKGYDVINLFNALTGRSNEYEQEYRKLLVAPRDMRNTFIQHIQEEVKNHKAHGNGHVIAIMNALDDLILIQEMYKASQVGVRIDLIVRGHCRLRPGLPGISENIQVVSILGRFLEHSRIFYFHKNNNPLVQIGSADWMRRNLDDRVEVVTELEDLDIKERAIQILHAALSDRRSSWVLGSNGRYSLYKGEGEDEHTSFQDVMMERIIQRRSDT